MSFTDWIHETAARFQNQPAADAAKESAHEFRLGTQRRVGRYVGTPIWERDDWDVLVVLDGCRGDQMQAVTTDYARLPGRVESVWSNASCSIDWINRTFNDHPKHAQQTGYVTANPFSHHETKSTKSADLSDDDLAYFAPLYKTHWTDITPDNTATDIHEESGRAHVGSGIATVPPDPVTNYGIDAWRRRDELGMNQLVLHYMQPHEPYRSRPDWGSGGSNLLENLIDDSADAGASIWPQVQAGNVPVDELWQAGVDNLHWVLEDVCGRLLENIDGDVVLTADHGNALGEWNEWHHPPGALSPACRKVPWVQVTATDQRTVTPNKTIQDGRVENEQDVNEQLEALGYK